MGTSPIISGVVDACTNTFQKPPASSTWCLPAAHEATGLTRSMVFKKAFLKILMKLCAMRSVTITDSWRHGMSPEGLTRAFVPWIYIYIYTIPEKCPKNTGIYRDIIELTPVPIHFDSKFTLFFLLIISIFHGRLLGGKSGRWRGGRHRGIRLVRRRHAATPRPVPAVPAPFRPQGRHGGRCGCRGHRGTGAPGAVWGRRYRCSEAVAHDVALSWHNGASKLCRMRKHGSMQLSKSWTSPGPVESFI